MKIIEQQIEDEFPFLRKGNIQTFPPTQGEGGLEKGITYFEWVEKFRLVCLRNCRGKYFETLR